ncbi:MAG: hypothetical protein WBX22_17220 [Silvibacterium sp.]|jgi:hypothetical protein
MPPFDKDNVDLPSRFGWNPHIIADWIDMPFVLQGVEGELRTEVLAIALETMANVHQNIADGTRKVANTIRGAQA